jgi:hypothetical protein
MPAGVYGEPGVRQWGLLRHQPGLRQCVLSGRAIVLRARLQRRRLQSALLRQSALHRRCLLRPRSDLWQRLLPCRSIVRREDQQLYQLQPRVPGEPDMHQWVLLW